MALKRRPADGWDEFWNKAGPPPVDWTGQQRAVRARPRGAPGPRTATSLLDSRATGPNPRIPDEAPQPTPTTRHTAPTPVTRARTTQPAPEISDPAIQPTPTTRHATAPTPVTRARSARPAPEVSGPTRPAPVVRAGDAAAVRAGHPSGRRAWTVARRVLAVIGRLVEVAAAAIIAWRVLVTLRGGMDAAATDSISGRIDASVARTLATDRVLSLTAWAGYLSTTLVLGGLVFRRFVSRTDVRPPRRRHRDRRGPRRRQHRPPHPHRPPHAPVPRSDAERLLRVAVALGLVAVACALPLRAAVVSSRGLAVLSDPQPMLFVLGSPFGSAAMLRAAGLGLVAASRAGGPLRAVAAVAGGAVLLASYLVVGHPQANHPEGVEIAAQAVHITAVSVWFAGVAYLAVELRQRRREGAPWLSGQVVSRFSRLAEVMVVLVLASGAVLTAAQVKLRQPFWTTPYGKALVAKLAFVAVVLAIGGYNRLRVVPAVAERDDEAAWRRLRATCVVESTVIALGVLLMTAAMTSGGFP